MNKKIIINRPTNLEINKRLNEWNNLTNYVHQGNALNKLFYEVFPNNNEINSVLIKVSSLNDFYLINIFDVFSVANHILSLDIDERLLKKWFKFSWWHFKVND